VFGADKEINIELIAKAIATYERTLITPDSAYDRFIRGDMAALNEKQLRGMVLFESMGCVTCHTGPNFSDASLYSDSQPYRIFPAHPNQRYEEKYQFSKDGGKMVERSADQQLYGVWRVPSLRNVAITGPYFHNGSVDDLEEAVRIMAQVQLNKTLSNRSSDDQSYNWSDIDKKMHVTTNSAISDEEVESLVAFLESLTGDVSRLSNL
jgi:cytochrome c peroxidase